MLSRYGRLTGVLLALILVCLAGLVEAGKSRPERINVPLDSKARTASSELNYLVTLSRTASNSIKDNVMAVLMEKGAVVKQVYDYRVYKGVLFSIPSTTDRGLKAWESTLLNIEGVKAVEEDTVVKANANSD